MKDNRAFILSEDKAEEFLSKTKNKRGGRMRNNNFLPKETVLRIIDSPRTKEQMVNMIKCIPEVEAVEIKDGATNGDVIKTLYPTMTKKDRLYNHDFVEMYFDDDIRNGSYLRVNRVWWNSPYKTESEE